MKTAVEQLVEALPQIHWDDPYYRDILARVKEVEKQQLREAFKSGRVVCLDNTRSRTPVSITADDYFTETYGKL